MLLSLTAGLNLTAYAEDECEHNFEIVVTEPTCTDYGYSTYTCTICGVSYTDDRVEASGHTWGDWADTAESTCSEYGTRTRVCSTCGEEDIIYLPKLEHTYTSEVTPPSCTEGGYTTYTCTVCGASYSDSYTIASGHNWGEPVVTTEAVEATCTEQGKTDVRTRTCSVCGESITIGGSVIPALGHDIKTDAAVAATCTTDGKTEGRHCTVCGEVITAQETIPALGHNWSDWKVTTAAKTPTCTERGKTAVETRSCTTCKRTETRGGDYIDALDHDYVADVTEPTCTEGGYTIYTCSRCKDSFRFHETAALHHKIVITNAVDPTFKKAGKTAGQKCSRCGKTIIAQKSIAKLVSPSVKQLKAGKKSFTATWKKAKTVDGYQIEYAANAKFTNVKIINVKKDKTTKKTVKKLKANKKYFVRVRAYKTINGKKVYSKWSKAKAVTTKK